ncbi:MULTISPECIES: tripartite tricarboxylate transporter permease [unclassified Pseudomonas]|uniref:tripartite tricarboxylate transporter permease n=1 Tax=unclassified Pseudomonas TaxID=196821 RepID=UPI0021CA7C4D|nr:MULTISPECIES: tripartite tricarboxylate transporter permease [unclassified Pseudomonas]MCU1734470.1 tripartite tricarboxylate transporter permease [Pseudomonas sp. 20P_3.2_Bac4]MCU1745553.1 tripartite tricarboxylate transporter permease [Pseudomonas sp. 20P_3.2_Bac5]
MELLDHLGIGLEAAFTLNNLLYCLLGVTLGTLVGVLPGLGPVATIAMLLPITYGLTPAAALIMLSGIYYGAQYGGSTTAILVNLPGESSSVVTCLDGHAMARKGRAGAALAIAAIGSFIAGSLAILLLAAAATPLAEVALKFGPAEYFSLMLLGLVAAIVLAQGDVLKAVAMTLLGLLLGLVGTDVNSGVERFTFGIPALSDGISFVVISMGIFGIAEIIANLERDHGGVPRVARVGSLLPSKDDYRRSWKPILRGTGLGALLGVLPGGGAMLGSFASYMVEKRLAKQPERFGQGAIEGVAGPESANNAGAQTSFIPMLVLGLPSNAVMALMAGAMMIHGIVPGPQVIDDRPELFWGLIVSMWIGNLLLLVLNLPLVGIWVRLLAVPYRLLYPSILLFCCIGVYSVNNSLFDVLLTVAFGLLGYLFIKLRCEPAPLLLGYLLGPLMEENLRRAMLLSRGDPTVFVTRPLSLTLLIVCVLVVVLMLSPRVRATRQVAFSED